MDAGLNRLSEALRAVEDVCRFHWNQSRFAGELKEMRHAVLTLFLGDGSRRTELLVHRDIEGDTGRNIPSPRFVDETAASPSGEALTLLSIRNLQRAKESLRSLARLVDADGVHVGQDDLPIHEVRQVLSHDFLVGVSTHSEPQLRRALREGADYVGVGPVFPTETKDAGPTLGVDSFGRLAGEVKTPVFAIGGIHEDNVATLVVAGAHRIAVSSAILRAGSVKDVREATQRLREALPPREAD